MTPSETSLGRHLSPSLDEARLERQVAAILEARGRPAAPRRRVLILSAVVACVAIAGAVTLRPGLAPRAPGLADAPPGTGTTFEAFAGGETITLADGSRVVLDPRSQLTLLTVRADLVRVRLDRGGADLDVVHADGKPFVVVARGYEIRVLGTRFSVRLLDGEGTQPPALEVAVARGRVRVTRVGEEGAAEGPSVRVLDAGETWSTSLDVAPASASAPPPVGAEGSAPRRTKAGAAADAGESARGLLARAEAARASNDPRAAARLFDALRLRHPTDARAGLAAFELGRLRLDRLGDPRGAAVAFADALARAPDAPFSDDAQARLVEALEASGDGDRCAEARATYLARYPRGVHREEVARRCSR